MAILSSICLFNNLPLLCLIFIFLAISPAPRESLIIYKKKHGAVYPSLTESSEKIPCNGDVVNSPRYMREPLHTLAS